MGVGSIRSGNENQISVINIFITRRGRVGAERKLVAADRRGHTQARVGIDIIGADQTLREFVEGVVVLGEQLARNVKADGIGAVGLDALGKTLREKRRRGVPRFSLARRRAAAARFRKQRTAIGLGGEMQGRALGA